MEYRSLSEKNKYNLYCAMREYPWESLLDIANPNECYTKFSSDLYLMGPYRRKITKLKKNASNEVSICSRCCCGILQLCDECKCSLGGVERHYNPSIFKKCLQKNRSPEKFQI